MTDSVTLPRSDTSSRSDGPSRSDGLSRSNGPSRSAGLESGHGAHDTLSRARGATERGLATAGRQGELTRDLVASGVLRDVCSSVKRPPTPFRAHPAEIEPALHRPGMDRAQVWQAQEVVGSPVEAVPETRPEAVPETVPEPVAVIDAFLDATGPVVSAGAGLRPPESWIDRLNPLRYPDSMVTVNGTPLDVQTQGDLSTAFHELGPALKEDPQAALDLLAEHGGSFGTLAPAFGRTNPEAYVTAALLARSGAPSEMVDQALTQTTDWQMRAAAGLASSLVETVDAVRALPDTRWSDVRLALERVAEDPMSVPEAMAEPFRERLAVGDYAGAVGYGLPAVVAELAAVGRMRAPAALGYYDGELAVSPGTMDAPGFAARADELAWERGVYNPEEGRAAARFEVAMDTKLARPDPPDPSIDFVDESGARIEIKGALVRTDGGPVTDGMVDGLIDAAVEEANLQSAADLIVVDVEGLSNARVEHVRERLQRELATGRSVIIQR